MLAGRALFPVGLGVRGVRTRSPAPSVSPLPRPPSDAVVIRSRRPTDRRSRAQRWRDAVAELIALQGEYTQWLAALPEATRDGATGDALQAILDLDLDEIAAVEPPRGFGRD
jgi:hypothetical protein